MIAVTLKAEEVSGAAISAWGLRIAVALGCFRIVIGTPLSWYIMAAYAVVIPQIFPSSRTIIPLAYDSGGVTTSTITVPVVATLGLGLAAAIPGRSPLIHGFVLSRAVVVDHDRNPLGMVTRRDLVLSHVAE